MLKHNRHQKPDLRLLLVRHGQTDWNAQGRWQGHVDTALNTIGLAQAEAVGRALADEPLDVIYASDLSRAWNTAQAISAHHHLDVIPEPRLREINLGDWQGLTADEITADNPELAQRWFSGEDMRSPNGESTLDLQGRARAVLEDTLAHHKGETVLWVAHGGVVRTTLCLTLGTPAADHWRYRAGSTSITELAFFERGPVLVRANDCHHLDGLGLPH